MSCPEDDTVLGTCAINRRLPSRTLTCGRLEDDTVQAAIPNKAGIGCISSEHAVHKLAKLCSG
jgi:hypothetical protein